MTHHCTTQNGPPRGSFIMNDMAHCELCYMDLQFCGHGPAERRARSAAVAGQLLISPSGVAHFRGARIRVTMRTTAAGRRLTWRRPGSAWGTAST